MPALMSYSEYKDIKGELKNIEAAFEMGQKVAFAYMADCVGASLTYGGLERVIKKIESGRRLKKNETKDDFENHIVDGGHNRFCHSGRVVYG